MAYWLHVGPAKLWDDAFRESQYSGEGKGRQSCMRGRERRMEYEGEERVEGYEGEGGGVRERRGWSMRGERGGEGGGDGVGYDREERGGEGAGKGGEDNMQV